MPFKGFKTIAFNALALLTALVGLPEFQTIFGLGTTEVVLGFMAVANTVLRFVTTTPIFGGESTTE